jgi:hypothetical protein
MHCTESTSKYFLHQTDRTKPLPKGLGSQVSPLCRVPFMSEYSKMAAQTLPLGLAPSWEGLCRHFRVFLHGGDPPHRAPTWLPAPQGSTLSTVNLMQTENLLLLCCYVGNLLGDFPDASYHPGTYYSRKCLD